MTSPKIIRKEGKAYLYLQSLSSSSYSSSSSFSSSSTPTPLLLSPICQCRHGCGTFWILAQENITVVLGNKLLVPGKASGSLGLVSHSPALSSGGASLESGDKLFVFIKRQSYIDHLLWILRRPYFKYLISLTPRYT